MFYAMTEREKLVGFLPPGGVGAEIGVAQGAFAQVLLEQTRPVRLHLIDPWHGEENDDGDPRGFLDAIENTPGSFYGPASSEFGTAQHRAVIRRFAGNPEVETYQQYSYKIAREFPDGYFDYVYIDGNHTYEYVLQDLFDFSAKLKPDGVLMGHDFSEDAHAMHYRYGIIDAVRRFLARSRDFRFFCLTHEPFPSYALVRSESGFAGQFIRNVLESDVFLVELGDEQAFRYEEKSFLRENGSVRRIPSFTL